MSANAENRDVARAVASRRANTYLRLGATLVIAAMLQIYMQPAWGWMWALVYTLCYTFELWARHPLAIDPSASLPTWRRVLALVSPFITSTAFGFLSLLLFASHIRFAPTLGGMLLAGALLNVIVVNAGNRTATLIAATPHVLYLLMVPLVAKAANPGANLADVLWFGALLMIVSVTVASRTLSAALKAEADAKAEAERRRHEAEEAVAAKSAFVAMISHELRTPISAILAGAARLHSEVPEPSSKIHAQLIADAGGLMRTLLNDLLDFSRLEAGRMSVEKTPFNLRQTLADTLRLWRPEATRKGLRLRVIGAARLPQWASGDGMRLRQVLNNLLSNAIKFTERGGVTVSLNANPPNASLGGDQLLLSIDVIDSSGSLDRRPAGAGGRRPCGQPPSHRAGAAAVRRRRHPGGVRRGSSRAARHGGLRRGADGRLHARHGRARGDPDAACGRRPQQEHPGDSGHGLVDDQGLGSLRRGRHERPCRQADRPGRAIHCPRSGAGGAPGRRRRQ
jgi:signal transduction histidine kinase